MKEALCLQNNERYDIVNFSQLDPALLNSLRCALVCAECGGNGYYNQGIKDGKFPYFGAYHEDGCFYKNPHSAPRFCSDTLEEVNRIIAKNDTIDVNFTPYTVSQVKNANSGTASTRRTASSSRAQQHTRCPEQTKHVTKGLRSRLRMLMYTDTFAKSDTKVNTGGKYPYKAKNLFVNFDEMSETLLENNKLRGYWGIINHADDGITWLNSANKQKVGIPLSKSNAKDYLTDVFNINNAEDLPGAAVLVFGWLKISQSDKNKWYIDVHENNPACIFIKPKNKPLNRKITTS